MTNTGMDVLGRQQSNSNSNSNRAVLCVHLDHPILLEDIFIQNGMYIEDNKNPSNKNSKECLSQ